MSTNNRITRRDHLGGMLLGTGAALVGGLSPRELLAATKMPELPSMDPATASRFNGPSGVGDYAGVNGNTWDVLSQAHWIRDGYFEDVDYDALPVDESSYDVVMIGGGSSSLGAAYVLSSASDQLRDGYGRIFFAHSELRGLQTFVGARAEGYPAARQVMAL